MNCPKFDFHIHTKYIGCANETMEVPAIIRECEKIGVTTLGITDHVDNLDMLKLHLPIKEDLKKIDTSIEIYFGVELNFLGFEQGFPFSQAIKDEYGFQFAIAGIHDTYLKSFDLKKLIDIQHDHHLRACRDPLVDVLVHPYWVPMGDLDPKNRTYFEYMKDIPQNYIRELAQVSKETDTAIEINTTSVISNPGYSDAFQKEYVEFLTALAGEGVVFAIGSDAHDISHLKSVRDGWNLVEKMNLPLKQIWRPMQTSQ